MDLDKAIASHYSGIARGCRCTNALGPRARRSPMARDGPVAVERMRRAFLVGSLLVVLAQVSLSALPAARIDVSIGFSGYFVPERIAPLRVTLLGIDPGFGGSLRVSEEVGNAWRGEAATSICIPIDGGSTKYEEAIPIYDFSHPLLVFLLDDKQHVVAQQELPLRDKWRSEPFVLLAGGFPSSVVPDAVQIRETELPAKFLSYEGVASVWLGRTAYEMTTEQQEAICRWTSAGGRTVLFTGSDFFRIDSPLMRSVLPLTDPHLADGRILLGDTRIGAQVLLRDSTGTPLVISRRFGAGEVFLVTVDAFSLPLEEYAKLRDTVPIADLLDLSDITASLLEQMPLVRPGYPTAIGIAAVLLFSLVVIASHVRKGAIRVILLLSTIIVCSLWSALYTNRAKRLCNVYTINTHVTVQALVGYMWSVYGVVYLGGMDSAELLACVDGAVLQELPRDLSGARYDLHLRCDRNALIVMSPDQMRLLRGGRSVEPSISLFLSGDERVEIENRLGVSLPYAVLISGAKSFVLGPISPGAHEYSATRETNGIMPAPAQLVSLYTAVSEAYDLSVGTWLVAGEDSDSIVERGDYREKVRVVKLFLVEGEKR